MGSDVNGMTPDEEMAVRRAFAGLEEMSDAWAAKVSLTAMVASVASKDDRESRIDALMRLAFEEGIYLGRISHASPDLPTPTAPSEGGAGCGAGEVRAMVVEECAMLVQNLADRAKTLHAATPADVKAAWGWDKQHEALLWAAGDIRALAVPSSAPAQKSRMGPLNISAEWCERMARAEPENGEIGAGSSAPAQGEVRDLAEGLRSTTEEMANRASVPMELWNRHSNNCLAAVAALSTPAHASEAVREVERLRTDSPPDDGRQFLAWAVDRHDQDEDGAEKKPRWCIVQWAPEYPGARPYWRWSVPGYTTSVQVLAWVPIPHNDWLGEHYAALTPPSEAAGKAGEK